MEFRFEDMCFDFNRFECFLEIYVDGQVQRQSGSRPQILWEVQFRQLIDEIGHHPTPSYIKLSRQELVFNGLGHKVNDVELSIQFKNNAYIATYGE